MATTVRKTPLEGDAIIVAELGILHEIAHPRNNAIAVARLIISKLTARILVNTAIYVERSGI